MPKTLIRSLTATVLTGALALAGSPAMAQSSSVEVPGVGEVTGLLDLVDLPGLDLTDPVLDTVTGVIDDLTALVEDILALTPLPNLLALQGADAIDAAIAFSQVTYEASDTAVLARDDLFADALTTGALQGRFDAPLLLTASGDLDRRTALELVRLGVEHLVIVGGEDAINPLVIQKLGIAGIDVTRVGGPTRIETAADAAAETAADATTAVLTRAYSAEGSDDSQAYADLLAVSPWAAENGWPVLLTQTDVLTGSVRDHLASSAISDIVIIGGTGAISQAVEDQLTGMGINVRRIAGPTRFGTAVAIARERGFNDSSDTDRLILAEGGSTRDDVWAPGFAAAAHGSRNDAPVLLTDGPSIPAETMQFITDGMADNLVDGGPAAVCATFVDPIACEAVGLLLIGNINDALAGLGLDLPDIPNLADVLRDLGLGDLADLLDGLDGTPDGIIEAVAAGDLQAVVDALLSSGDLALIDGLADGLLGGSDGGTGDGDGSVLDPITDPLDDLLGEDDGSVTEPVTDIVDGLLGSFSKQSY